MSPRDQVVTSSAPAHPWVDATVVPEPAGPEADRTGLLDLLLETAGDGLMEWDLATDRIQYSPRWKMLLGYEEQELADASDLWRTLSHPDDLPRVDELMRDHLELVWPFSHCWRMRHRNGEWRWILCRAMSLRDREGTPTRLLALFTDINDQMRAEERQKTLATAIPDLMLRLRIDGVVLDEKRDERGQQLFSPIVVGQLLDGGALGDDWAAIMLGAVREAVETSRIVLRECAVAGGSVAFDLRVVRSGPDEGVCILRDITERKLAEQRLQDRQAEVEMMHLRNRQRLEGELAIAAHIQASLLPALAAKAPIQNLEIGCHMLPATEVGGDYFDVRPCHDGAWLAIGDVSGHGLNAGLIMLMVQSAIASLVTEAPDASPGRVLRTANRVLYENIHDRLKGDDYITLTLLRYFADGRLLFAGAHEDIVILRAPDGRIEQIPTPGTWLGAIVDLGPDVPETWNQLFPGDLLVLHTDGLSEARNATGAQLGVTRLAAAVAEVRDRPVDAIREHVQGVVTRWTTQREDDMSLVIARYR